MIFTHFTHNKDALILRIRGEYCATMDIEDISSRYRGYIHDGYRGRTDLGSKLTYRDAQNM